MIHPLGLSAVAAERGSVNTPAPIIVPLTMRSVIILVQSVVFIGIVLLFMPFLQKNSGETIYELNQSN
jgi:hypothetical protein